MLFILSSFITKPAELVILAFVAAGTILRATRFTIIHLLRQTATHNIYTMQYNRQGTI